LECEKFCVNSASDRVMDQLAIHNTNKTGWAFEQVKMFKDLL